MLVWVVYFFIYAFVGWIYESIYVSIKLKKLTNRGFMHGPIIPIYGFGGIICVFCGIYSNQNLIYTVIAAVIICTSMELFTGITMEELFKVRYWNYDRYRFNIRGYICPQVSLVWAFMAFLVNIIVQPFVVDLVNELSKPFINWFGITIIIFSLIDSIIAYSEAIDLRATYEEFTDNNKNLILLQQKIDNMQIELGDNIDDIKDKLKEISNEARSSLFTFRINGNIYLQNSKQVERLSAVKNRLSNIDSDRLSDLLEEIDTIQIKLRSSLNKNHSKAKNILKRNPESISTRIEKQIKKYSHKEL